MDARDQILAETTPRPYLPAMHVRKLPYKFRPPGCDALSAALLELVDALIEHRERKRDEETPDVLEFISVR
jgi:hypothetical protein